MKINNAGGKIYFDYAATTPCDPRVVDKMMPYFSQHFGNPSSIHSFGQMADYAVEESRQTVSEILNCSFDEIIFTSCGTESDNLALRGAAFQQRLARDANHILISPVEHHAVLNTAQQLADIHGFEVEFLPVDNFGIVNPDDVKKKLRKDTAVVSVVYANNEIGSINPISSIGAVCRSHNIPFHTDAVQAGAFLTLNVEDLNVDLLSLGAHKFYGPKGVGVLFKRKSTSIVPIQSGGGQEFKFRAGTHNVPLIVGIAEALRISLFEQSNRIDLVRPLRDRLIEIILSSIPETKLTGHPINRLPNHASFVFKGVDGNHLLMVLDSRGFACSSGSACRVGDPHPSEVLTAIGLDPEWALGSLRISLGAFSNLHDTQSLLDKLPSLIQSLRKLTPE